MTAEQEQQSATLMVRAQDGDQVAYAALLTLLTTLTRQFARRHAGVAPWVDDVVQETLMSVHRARQTYDPRRPFAPWFYAIASNRMIDVIRRERRVQSREVGTDTLPERVSGERPSAEAVDTEAMRAALASLPARQREIIEGLKLRDESVRTLAHRHGMTESAVKVSAHRGYRALRRILRRDDREE